MKNKFFGFVSKLVVVVAGCLMFASFSPSLDGRAVVVDEGVFPEGLFAKTVGYLPGDTISVTNISGNQTIDILVIGALDASEGVAIMLSPEAAKELGIEPASNCIVKITKRSGIDERVYGTAVIATQNVELSDEDIDAVAPEEEAVAENTADEEYDEEFSYTPEEEPEESLEEEFEDDYVANPEYETIPAAEGAVEEEEYEEPEEIEEELESEDYIPDDEFYAEEAEETEAPEEEVAEEEDFEEEFEAEEADEPAVEEELEAIEEPEVTDEELAEIEPEEDFEEEDFLGEELPVEEYVEDVPETTEAEETTEETYIPDDEFYMDAVETAPIESVIAEPVVEESLEEEVPAEEFEVEAIEEEVEPLAEEDEYEPIVLVPVEPAVAESIIRPVEEIEIEEVKEEVAPAVTPSVKAEVATPATPSYADYLVNSLKDLDSSKYYIQIAALGNDANILELVNKYGKHYPIVVVPKEGTKVKYIFVGPLNVDEYKVVLERFKSYGFKDAFIKKLK